MINYEEFVKATQNNKPFIQSDSDRRDQATAECFDAYELAAMEACAWLSEDPLTIGALIAEGKSVTEELDRIERAIVKQAVDKGMSERTIAMSCGDPAPDIEGERAAVALATRLAAVVHAQIVSR